MNLVPWAMSWNVDILRTSTMISDPFQDIMKSYYQSIMRHCYRKSNNDTSRARFVYTAMHGVGWPFMEAAFETFGLPQFIPVTEQVIE